MTRIEVRICGLGGQGLMLAGRILGYAAVFDGKNAVQTQSYGAEARGSAAKSEVVISDGKIGFPLVRKCDILVAMSQNAFDHYIKSLKKNGLALTDEDLVKTPSEIDFKLVELPTTKVAETQLKAKVYANVIMLGALTKITNIVSEDAMISAISCNVNPETAKANLSAFKKGLSLPHKHRS